MRDAFVWQVECAGLPGVVRHCRRCGDVRTFECSGNFRVNAQKRRLDAWLIYRCAECGQTWNLSVLSRVSPKAIAGGMLEGMLRNDEALARSCALDGALIRRCGATPAPPELSITGALPPPGSRAAIVLVPAYPLPVRAEAVLRAGLGLSRSALERLSAQGSLRAVEGDIMRIKLSAIVHVEIDLPWPPCGSRPVLL